MRPGFFGFEGRRKSVDIAVFYHANKIFRWEKVNRNNDSAAFHTLHHGWVN
jgi:hypothetical protein